MPKWISCEKSGWTTYSTDNICMVLLCPDERWASCHACGKCLKIDEFFETKEHPRQDEIAQTEFHKCKFVTITVMQQVNLEEE